MFAYDLENDKLLWRSADQTYNSMNFVVKGMLFCAAMALRRNRIICIRSIVTQEK